MEYKDSALHAYLTERARETAVVPEDGKLDTSGTVWLPSEHEQIDVETIQEQKTGRNWWMRSVDRFFAGRFKAGKFFTARFIGETSCGFEKGRVYHINIYQDTELRFVWVTDAAGGGCCAYGSLKDLAANWECPVK